MPGAFEEHIHGRRHCLVILKDRPQAAALDVVRHLPRWGAHDASTVDFRSREHVERVGPEAACNAGGMTGACGLEAPIDGARLVGKN